MPKTDVVIIGSGPAGLHAAIALRTRYGVEALVLEREAEPGGVPRWCRHHSFPCRVKKRLFDGPGYVRAWLREAEAAGVRIRRETTVLALDAAGPAVEITSPEGVGRIEARAVLLAVGARESHRHQRLVAGDRPPGVYTTASLFQSLYLTRSLPQQRFVIVGSEDVSYSCAHALRRAGREVAAVLETAPATRSWPIARWYFERLRGVSHYFGVEGLEVRGRGGVDHVAFFAGGAQHSVGCDAVVFTGGFTPNAELVRASDLEFNPHSRGPSINQCFQTSSPGVFAAGNCLRGAVTADEAAWEGRTAAGAIAAWLDGRLAPAREVRLAADAPIGFASPDRIREGGAGMTRVALWPARHGRGAVLLGESQGTRFWRSSAGAVQPCRRLFVPLSAIPLAGPDVRFQLSFDGGGA
jgi:thioredoxin reductase